jgi:hypothetical protein
MYGPRGVNGKTNEHLPRNPPPKSQNHSVPSSSRGTAATLPSLPEERRDVRPSDLPLPSGPSPRRPSTGALPRTLAFPAAPRPRGLRTSLLGFRRAAGLPALDAGGRPAERQPRAAAGARGGGDVGGGAVAGGLQGGAARRGASLLVPQHPLGPPALPCAAGPLRPLPRPLPRGHAARVRPQARPQPARRLHGHRHHHHDPAPAAAHVMVSLLQWYGFSCLF